MAPELTGHERTAAATRWLELVEEQAFPVYQKAQSNFLFPGGTNEIAVDAYNTPIGTHWPTAAGYVDPYADIPGDASTVGYVKDTPGRVRDLFSALSSLNLVNAKIFADPTNTRTPLAALAGRLDSDSDLKAAISAMSVKTPGIQARKNADGTWTKATDIAAGYYALFNPFADAFRLVYTEIRNQCRTFVRQQLAGAATRCVDSVVLLRLAIKFGVTQSDWLTIEQLRESSTCADVVPPPPITKPYVPDLGKLPKAREYPGLGIVPGEAPHYTNDIEGLFLRLQAEWTATHVNDLSGAGSPPWPTDWTPKDASIAEFVRVVTLIENAGVTPSMPAYVDGYPEVDAVLASNLDADSSVMQQYHKLLATHVTIPPPSTFRKPFGIDISAAARADASGRITSAAAALVSRSSTAAAIGEASLSDASPKLTARAVGSRPARTAPASESILDQAGTLAQAAAGTFAAGVFDAYEAAIARAVRADHFAASGFGEAAKSVAGSTIKSIAQQSIAKAGFELGEGIRSLADRDSEGASAHFATAGEFFALGTLGGAAAGKLSPKGSGATPAAKSTAQAASPAGANPSGQTGSGSSGVVQQITVLGVSDPQQVQSIKHTLLKSA